MFRIIVDARIIVKATPEKRSGSAV